MVFGWHLTLDMHKLDASISSPEKVELWVRELVKKIDMVPYGEPLIKHFGEGELEGITAVQLIMTSSIVAHFCDHPRTGYIDVFSCKEFDYEVVKKWTLECFGGEIFGQNTLIRGDDMV